MHDGMEKSQSVFNRKQFIMVCALAGLLLLGGVLGVSAHSDLQNAEKQFEDTISYVKEQCTGYDNLNLATETKSLMRMMENAQHLCREIAHDRQDDPRGYWTMPLWWNICGTIPSAAHWCFQQRAKFCAQPHRMAGRLTCRSGNRWKRSWPVLSC